MKMKLKIKRMLSLGYPKSVYTFIKNYNIVQGLERVLFVKGLALTSTSPLWINGSGVLEVNSVYLFKGKKEFNK